MLYAERSDEHLIYTGVSVNVIPPVLRLKAVLDQHEATYLYLC